MGITIKEIAELCGTSRGTVDRVFNKRGLVNKELADKITKIAAENNYTPNPTAKLLVASQKKYVIGVIVNSIGNTFFIDVLDGIESARKNIKGNISLILIELKGYNPEEQIVAIDKLIEQKIDALAITPVESELVVNKINEIQQKGMPVAFINSDLNGCNRLVMVGADNKENGGIAGNIALLSLSESSKIAIVTGSYANQGNKKRVYAFSDVIRESNRAIEVVDVLENHDDNDLSYEIVSKLLSKKEKIDLIYFCAGGIKGGIQAIVDSGKSTKAITVDQSNTIKKYLDEGLIFASITQDPYEQGYRPIRILADYLVFGTKPLESKIHTESNIKLKYTKW